MVRVLLLATSLRYFRQFSGRRSLFIPLAMVKSTLKQKRSLMQLYTWHHHLTSPAKIEISDILQSDKVASLYNLLTMFPH